MKLTRRSLVRVAVAASAGALVPSTVQAAPAGLSFVPVTPPQVGHAEHVCYCEECRPDVYVALPKQGEHHVAMRFGDRWWRAWLDGVEVKGLQEALAGERGYVEFLPSTVHPEKGWTGRHICGFKNSVDGIRHFACRHIAYGRVEIQRMDGH